ncbi:MAG: glycosyltransferase family 1 protein [Hyphomicrobiales bacterium]
MADTLTRPTSTSPAQAPREGELRLVLACGNYNYIKDGAVFSLNKLVQYLEAKGVEVMILSPVMGEPAFESYGTVTNIPSLPLPGRSEYRLALTVPADVKRKIEAFRPTLFHVASPDPLGYSATMLAKRMGVPVVASYHARHDLYIKYYKLGFLSGTWQRYLRRLYRPCAQVYAPSTEIIEFLKSEGISNDIRLWSRGVESDRFRPERRSLEWRRAQGFADDEVVVAFVGRLVVEKNVDVVVKVFRELDRRGVRYRQLFVGEGPERARLKAELPNAVFTGYLDGDALATAYASADVFFFPSITETFGIVTLEAMASGLPAVCAMATGTQSLVVEGETGFLLDQHDTKGFANAIERLVGSNNLRVSMGQAGLEKSRRYSWTAVMQSLEANYREVLANARKTST